ncbi:MAG: bacillithiol system redox-active protein YtxJ [Saprospiraceae bacterium]
MIKWLSLETTAQVDSIIDLSKRSTQIIFKHSTRCPISGMAKNRLEQAWDIDIEPYLLDLITFRSVSNSITDTLEVVHQSPQVIVINNGKAVYNESHLDINMSDLKTAIK